MKNAVQAEAVAELALESEKLKRLLHNLQLGTIDAITFGIYVSSLLVSIRKEAEGHEGAYEIVKKHYQDKIYNRLKGLDSLAKE